ncbi:MAG: hypothetical protein IPO21_12265 [Bacteroidales bacterium]|nr:hypothetical protein [Bacteroidales bacterium]
MSSILVIDDSEINTMLIKSIFEEESDEISVYVELNSKNALATIEQLMPSIILLDLMILWSKWRGDFAGN